MADQSLKETPKTQSNPQTQVQGQNQQLILNQGSSGQQPITLQLPMQVSSTGSKKIQKPFYLSRNNFGSFFVDYCFELSISLFLFD